MLDDPIFRDAVKHNALLLLSVPVVLVLALAIAFVLHEAITGWRVYRTIVFLPYMIAIPVLGTTFVYLLSLNGALNETLRSRRPRLPGPGLARRPVVGARHDRRDHHLPRARLRGGAVPGAPAEPARGGRPGGAARRLHLVAAAHARDHPADARRHLDLRDARADHDDLVGLRVRVLDDQGRARTSRATSSSSTSTTTRSRSARRASPRRPPCSCSRQRPC